MSIIVNYNYVYNQIKLISKKCTLVVVSKNQGIDKINLLIKEGHFDFGENKVQETLLKWKNLILNNAQLRLHLVGKLQTNKAKEAFKIFHYIHTLDNEKLAQIFAKLENDSSKKIKYFIQVNLANEVQKNGISLDKLNLFVKYCIHDLKLNIVGLMCIPPVDDNPVHYFKILAKLANIYNLKELSMGMSNDYECAIKNGSTFVRVGSKIFNSY